MPYRFSHFQESLKDFPVILVGAGPAGISTWLHLHKYFPDLASQTLVIDKKVFPRDKLCAGGLGAWSEDILSSLNIDLNVEFLSVDDVQFRLGKDKESIHYPNFFKIVQRSEFDYTMIKTAVDRGMTIHEDEGFIGIQREHNELLVQTNRQIYRTKVIIGADGALSRVARRTISDRKNRLAPTIQTYTSVDPVKNTQFSQKRIVLNLEPIKEGLQGYLWHVPCLRSNGPSIAHGIGDFRICRDKPRVQLKHLFSRELQSQNIPRDPISWRSHPVRWLSIGDTISQPNVLLVGDAAGIEPAFGGGIHISLSYGDIAARAIYDAFQKDDFSFHDYSERLEAHAVGKYISRCTRLSKEMYEDEADPLHLAHEFFTQKFEYSNLLSLLLSGPRPSPKIH